MKKYRSDKGASSPFFGLSWEMMDSAAWKCLSTDATWVYSQMHRRWHGGRFILPFRDVAWKMPFAAFSRARKGLLDFGFIVILERHGLDGKATVYGSSDKWKEISRALMADRTAGRIVKRLRRVNGEARLVSEWEPIRKHSESFLASRRACLKVANEAKKGVRASDQITSPRRPSKKELTPEGPDKHSNRICVDANGDTPIVVCVDGNGGASSRLRGRKRPICVDANDNAKVRPVPVTAPPSEHAASASLRIPPMDIIAEAAARLGQGKTIPELKAWIEQQGYDPERVRWSALS